MSDFKEHFEGVSKDRYEERPDVIEMAAEELNEWLNKVSERIHIMDAMKETRVCTWGGGVRIVHIRKACEELQDRVM